MDILFLHPNMPGQYKHLARALGAENKHRIFFVTKHKTAQIDGVTRVTYRPAREPSAHTHRYLMNAERAVLQGQEVWRVCKKLRDETGFAPQLVVGHPGWGDMLFVKDIFPHARVVSFCEFYYRATGADMGFAPDEPLTPDDFARGRIKNVNNILNLEMMDWGLSPTVWQWSVHPSEYRGKMSVLHDGIDTQICAPNPQAIFHVKNGPSFKVGDEVITHIERNFEPYRGFATFMQAAEIILRERPNAHIVVVGADGVSYGKPAPRGTTYRKLWLEKTTLDRSRIHFVGTLAYEELVKMLQVSAAHLYLTYPFVLSWSLMEAMAMGCAIVASDTKPVQEVMSDSVHGLLADFFSPEEFAQKTITLLESKDANAQMRAAARQKIVAQYDLKTLLPLHQRLVMEIAEGALPPPVARDIAALLNPEQHSDMWWCP